MGIISEPLSVTVEKEMVHFQPAPMAAQLAWWRAGICPPLCAPRRRQAAQSEALRRFFRTSPEFDEVLARICESANLHIFGCCRTAIPEDSICVVYRERDRGARGREGYTHHVPLQPRHRFICRHGQGSSCSNSDRQSDETPAAAWNTGEQGTRATSTRHMQGKFATTACNRKFRYTPDSGAAGGMLT